MWEPATRGYLEAISRDGKNPMLFWKLGDLQKRCGDWDGAAETRRYAAMLERGAFHDEPRPCAFHRSDLASAYLELMKECLTFLLWGASDGPLLEMDIRQPIPSLAWLFQRVSFWLRPASGSARKYGKDWPAQALTMVGRKRLDNIQECVERALEDDIPGDLIETGVWRGGATIFMRAILRAYNDTQRKVWVADSFRGLPRPNIVKYPEDRGYDLSRWRSLAVFADEVRANFQRFGLLDNQVEFLEGWFADTLPLAPITRLAVLRLDGDLYESTMDSLANLYHRLSPGGFVIVDDYYNSPPCQKAINDFRRTHAIEAEMIKVDWSGAFWRKP